MKIYAVQFMKKCDFGNLNRAYFSENNFIDTFATV